VYLANTGSEWESCPRLPGQKSHFRNYPTAQNSRGHYGPNIVCPQRGTEPAYNERFRGKLQPHSAAKGLGHTTIPDRELSRRQDRNSMCVRHSEALLAGIPVSWGEALQSLGIIVAAQVSKEF